MNLVTYVLCIPSVQTTSKCINVYLCVYLYIPVLTDSFILIAQMGGSDSGGRAPTSKALKAIRRKGAMVTAHISLLEKDSLPVRTSYRDKQTHMHI